MSAISKSSIPSLLDISILSNWTSIGYLVQNARFLKQARFPSSFEIWNLVDCHMNRDSFDLFFYVCIQTSFSKEALNSNRLQAYDYLNELGFSNVIARCGVLIIAIVLMYLEHLQAASVYKTAAPLLLNYFFKNLESVKPRISDTFYRQILPMTKIFEKDLKSLCKLPEKQADLCMLCPKSSTKTKIFAKDLGNLREFSETSKTLCLFYPKILPNAKRFAKYYEHFRMSPRMPEISIPPISFYLQLSNATKEFPKNLEHYRKGPEILPISDIFYPQMLHVTTRFANDLESSLKVPETQLSSIKSHNVGSQCLKSYQNDSNKLFKVCPVCKEPTCNGFCEWSEKSTKLYGQAREMLPEKNSLEKDLEISPKKIFKACFLCQETIAMKKFFGERRFGILSNCDCVICYGCIRKELSTSCAILTEHVCCPSCNVISDTVAASTYWIEGEAKVKFCDAYRKNREFFIRNRKCMPEVFPIRKNIFFNQQTVELVT